MVWKYRNWTLTANWVTLLDLLTFLDADFDDHTTHGGTHRARIRGGLLPRNCFDSGVTVLDRYRADLTLCGQQPIITAMKKLYFSVDFEPDVALGTTFHNRTDSHQTDNESLALLDGNMHFLSDVWTTKEIARGDDAGKQSVQ